MIEVELGTLSDAGHLPDQQLTRLLEMDQQEPDSSAMAILRTRRLTNATIWSHTAD